MNLPVNFSFSATAIGSLPYSNPLSAVREIKKFFSEIPFWPQLPRRSFLENMYAQFSDHLPNLVIDERKKSIHFIIEENLWPAIEKFYERYLRGKEEDFAIGSEKAAGFYAFLAEVKKNLPPTLKYLKGHLTGPISYALTLTDEKRKAILYHPELAEVVVKNLAMKAKWQVRKLKEVFPRVIIFIDEPYLVSIGSAYVSLKKEEVGEKINEVISAIHQAGAIAGIHCCGNTDWALLMETKTDIISFDAYNFGDSLGLYLSALKKFFREGGALAWGIVPSSERIKEESAENLWLKLDHFLKQLLKKGLEKEVLQKRSLLTPSCGMGALSEELAEEIMKKLAFLSQKAKDSLLKD